MNVQKAVNDTQSKCLGSTLREARVLIPPLLITQGPVHTPAQSLVQPNQHLKSVQQPPEKPLAEPNQHSIPGLPVVHLSLSLANPPWVQLSQRGILPMAETICQSTQTFAGRVSLFRSNWEAPIVPQHRNMLLFNLEGKTYQFNCLPFGLCTAPRVFTKVLKPSVEMLRSLGIRLVIYMDDMLLMASSEQMLMEHIQLSMYLLENLGFIINSKKSILCPSQEIEFLGMLLNSITMEIKLPGEKIKKIRQEAHRLLAIEKPSAHLLSQLLGKLNATTPALQMAPSSAAHFKCV